MRINRWIGDGEMQNNKVDICWSCKTYHYQEARDSYKTTKDCLFFFSVMHLPCMHLLRPHGYARVRNQKASFNYQPYAFSSPTKENDTTLFLHNFNTLPLVKIFTSTYFKKINNNHNKRNPHKFITII